ncbi:carbamate kinase [Glutamicibacter sp.]|uniref:carbamate kinase n=1 Tax=Glutamicibacter sp. TaxID=1931995 RepID=UPI0028BDE6F8|nr:carbamate kinase [Glutamicibacter sp.]
MRIVIALGGNALARRGEPMTAEKLRANVRSTCQSLAKLAGEHELVITHGNGPQVGLLALQNLAYKDVPAYPLDVLGAESQGMIGYVVQQELSNALDSQREVITLLTTTIVNENDPAFEHPTKFVGPTYAAEEADAVAAEHDWIIARDGKAFRRVVPSPEPLRIAQASIVSLLLDNDKIVVCAGGGGVPVRAAADGGFEGVQAVVDKDLASAVLSAELQADLMIILTDGDYAAKDWGTDTERSIFAATPEEISKLRFQEGSMKPKVNAGIRFAQAGGKVLIGPLGQIDELLARKVGTEISNDIVGGIVWVDEHLSEAAASC